MEVVINRRTVLLVLSVVGVGFGLVMWFRNPPSKASQLQPLLADIDRYRFTNGAYPTTCVSFASFAQITQRFTIYTGGRDTNGVTWETRAVSDHDFTVLVDRAGYEVFLPVGHMKMISFSSFPVWRIDSSQQQWQRGRIHWSYGGSYWSVD